MRLMAMLILLVMSALPAWADVYKCPDGKGGTRFQDAPCTGSDETPMVITMPTPPPPVFLPTPLPPVEQPLIRFDPPKDPAIAELFKALRKLNAATDVGITKIEYGKLVVEAKAAANDALPKLPPGELHKELKAAMDLHADALQTWNSWFRMGLPGHPSSLSASWISAEWHVKRAMELVQQPAAQ